MVASFTESSFGPDSADISNEQPWEDVIGAMSRLSNAFRGNDTAYHRSRCLTPLDSVDHKWSGQLSLGNPTSGSSLAGLVARYSPTADTCYALAILKTGGVAGYECRIYRYDAGVSSVLQTGDAVGHVNNDQYEIEVVGGLIVGRRLEGGPVDIISTTDPSPLTSGSHVGVWTRAATAASRTGTYVYGGFQATALSTGPAEQSGELARVTGASTPREIIRIAGPVTHEIDRDTGLSVVRSVGRAPGAAGRLLGRPAQPTGTARTLSRAPGATGRDLSRLTGTSSVRSMSATLAGTIRELERITGAGLERVYTATSVSVRQLARLFGVSVPRQFDPAPGPVERELPRLAATDAVRDLQRTAGNLARTLQRTAGVSVLRALTDRLLGFYRDLTVSATGPKGSSTGVTGPRGATMGVTGPKGSPFSVTGPRR